MPYEGSKYYYRLKDHEPFLRGIGLTFRSVVPRMSRDFEITLETKAEAEKAQEILFKFTCDGKENFGHIDILDQFLLVTLTVSDEIDESLTATNGDVTVNLSAAYVYVGLKNGEHSGKGFAWTKSFR